MTSARRWLVAGTACLAVGMAFAGIQSTQPAAAVAATAGAPGTVVDNFRLTDDEFMGHDLYEMSNASAVVLITQGNGCPISRNTGMTMNALKDKFADQGVEFFMLNANIQDRIDEIHEERVEFGYDMPILVDDNQLVAEQLGVDRTAEVFVLDPKTWQIVYRGPVDDRVTYERQKAEATTSWADDALTNFLAGRPIEVAQRPSPGCIINLLEAGREEQHRQISYAETIAPIIEENCVTCHQPGGIGPMELVNYEDILGHSQMIREVLRTDRMPPYHADPRVGEFKHDYNMASQDIKTLVHWVEAGSPRGEGPDPLAAVHFEAPEWPLGEPDLVLTVPAFDVPASGIVDYKRPWAANPLNEGHWLRASTVIPGERQAVHHVLTGYMDEVPSQPEVSESRWGASVGGYAVGAESTLQPDDVGTFLPAGGAVGFQMHYTPFGRDAVDETRIGLYFYEDGEVPTYLMRSSVIADPTIELEANNSADEEVAYMTFPADALLYSAFPHAHYRGKSSKLEIEYPDGRREMVLVLPRYDFNWQRGYEFEEPLEIPAGSKLIATYTYDNSERNPANPDPNTVVTWGEQSFEEMLYTAVRFRWVNESVADPHPELMAQLNATRQFGMMDDNINGLLEMSELRGAMGAPMRAAFSRLDSNSDGGLDPDELAAAQDLLRGGLGRRASR